MDLSRLSMQETSYVHLLEFYLYCLINYLILFFILL